MSGIITATETLTQRRDRLGEVGFNKSLTKDEFVPAYHEVGPGNGISFFEHGFKLGVLKVAHAWVHKGGQGGYAIYGYTSLCIRFEPVGLINTANWFHPDGSTRARLSRIFGIKKWK
jgi:hypothetical protein